MARTLLVLGLGNVLCADDGVGVAAVDLLERGFRLPPSVRALDGGTLGLSLMSLVEEADDLLIVDAIRADAAPGSLVELEGDEVAPAVRDRLSVHQVGVSDFLDGLRWLGREPARLALVGLVPVRVSWGPGLSAEVRAGLPGLLAAVAARARSWGHALESRAEPVPASEACGGIARVLGL